MTANPTNQINKRTMKFEKEFNEAHPEMIGEKDRAFYESNYMDWLEDQYITANSLEPKTEQPTGETVFRKVSVRDRNPSESRYYFTFNDPFGIRMSQNYYYADKKEWSSETHYWLEEIPLPTQSGLNKVDVGDSFNGNEKMQNHIKEYLKSKGYGANPEKVTQENFNDMLRVALVKGMPLGEISDRCWVICQQAILQALQYNSGLNKEEIIKWIDKKFKEVENSNNPCRHNVCISLSECKYFILSLPSPAQREEGEAVDGETILLLRETAMRGQIAFPQSQLDDKWFNEGYEIKHSGDFMNRLFKALSLDIDDNEIERFKNKISE